MASDFLLQIVNRHTGDVVVSWEPGGRVETDIIASVLAVAKAQGVGFFATEAQVEAAIHSAWTATLHALKAQVTPLP